MDNIIGSNIKQLREKQGLTQEMLADLLGIGREMLNYYENGRRNIPTDVITKVAEYFCVDEYDLFEENSEVTQANVAFAFRANNLKEEDYDAIGEFKKVAMNYLKMQKIKRQ
jgi:transcriptional regulator with XRE-family HTH domain